MSAIASALACTLKFVNLFARCQHLFDITVTLIYLDSNFLSYLLSYACYKMSSFNVFAVMITFRKFNQNLFIFLPCDAMHKRRLCRSAVLVRPSVCLYVTFVYSVEMSKRILKLFSSSDRPIILVFPY